MPKKKASSQKASSQKPSEASGPALQIILEEIRSQYRVTIEAIENLRSELRQEIAELRRDTNAHFQVLEAAARGGRSGT